MIKYRGNGSAWPEETLRPALAIRPKSTESSSGWNAPSAQNAAPRMGLKRFTVPCGIWNILNAARSPVNTILVKIS
jgi:hypothetical protein